MNDHEYFLNTSLSYQLKAACRELADFRSGEACQKLRRDYEGIIRSQKREMGKLRRERDGLPFTRKEITRQWTEVMDDMSREHEKEVKKLKKTIAELMDIIASLTNRNTEPDGQKKELLHKFYETASQLEDARDLIVKLKAQASHNYENSSLPSSKCIERKKITNNREKTGKEPGAQPGHEHHPRKKLTPTQTVETASDEKYQDTARYIPTGKTITKQVAGVAVHAVVTQYSTLEFYDRETGHRVHSVFPDGVTDDVNYDGSLKTFAFLLSNRCAFENFCKEDKNIRLDDGTVKVFLNSESGMDDVSRELKAFLDYVAGRKSEDPFVIRLEEAVKEARKNREWRHEYMTLLMRDQENIEKGFEQGIEKGIEKGIKKGIEKGKIWGSISMCRDFGMPDDMISKKLQEKYNLSEEEAMEYLQAEMA